MKKHPEPIRRNEPAERVERTRQVVLATTFELLTEAGFGGVSVDEISRRSGVAKTTIYRHWPTRSALLLSACSNLGVRPQPPDTGTLWGDLQQLVPNMAANLRTARWATVLPSIIDAAERDPDLARVYSGMQQQFMAALTDVLERAQRRGEISRSEKVSNWVAAIAGPLFYRRWFSREPIDEGFVKDLLRRVIKTTKAKKNM